MIYSISSRCSTNTLYNLTNALFLFFLLPHSVINVLFSFFFFYVKNNASHLREYLNPSFTITQNLIQLETSTQDTLTSSIIFYFLLYDIFFFSFLPTHTTLYLIFSPLIFFPSHIYIQTIFTRDFFHFPSGVDIILIISVRFLQLYKQDHHSWSLIHDQTW